MKEVDATLIDRHGPPLALTPAPVLTIERCGYSNIQAIYNDDLSRLQNGKIKRRLYLERRLITTRMTNYPRLEVHFRKYGFDLVTRSPYKYNIALVLEFYTAYKRELPR